MRTTLSLEDDVAASLERLRKEKKISLKQAVNQALRQGLREMAAPARRRQAYKTPTASLGRCLMPSLDDVAEVLAVAEGEDYQ